MSPRKSSAEELTKDMILNVARAQFSEKAYLQVSMRNIAKELGCSHGAIYYHFQTKAELFYAIIERSFAALNQRMEEIIHSPETNQSKLENLFLSFIEFGLNHQSDYEMMFMIRNEEVNALTQEAANVSYMTFAQTVQQLSAAKLRIHEIYSAFLALHGFVSHYCGQVSNYEEAKDAAQLHVTFISKALSK